MDSHSPSEQPQPEVLKERPTELPGITLEELEQQCQDLRTLLHATLVALVVLTLGIALVLAKQMRTVRQEVAETRRVIQRVDLEFAQKEPRMKSFIAVLQTYAAINPDFQPILNRYRVAVPQYFTDPVSVTAPPPTRFPSTSSPPTGPK
jgi:hypothetical protein